MPSSIYPSSCLLPQLLLVLRIYWVNINSIIFFSLYVPHQTNYSLIAYTTNWKIQAIWRWMKKMHTQASPRSEHQNLIDDRRALFSKSIPVIVSTNIFLAHGVYDEVQSSKIECLLTPPPPITPPPSRSPSKNLTSLLSWPQLLNLLLL